MNLQTILDDALAAHRAARMAESDQLTLGEIVTKLDAVADKTKLVRFDFGTFGRADEHRSCELDAG